MSAEEEVRVTLSVSSFCEKCPSKAEGNLANDILCPIAALIREIGKNPDPEKMAAAVKKYGLVYSDALTSDGNADITAIKCPIADGGVVFARIELI